MNISRRLAMCVCTTLAMLFCVQATAARGGNGRARSHSNAFYQPITIYENNGQSRGIWLVNGRHPTNPIIQITSATLDGTASLNAGIFATWQYRSARQEAVRVAPRLLVYGLGGRLYSEDLLNPGVPQQFSSGSYSQLCSLKALDGQPYQDTTSYLQAVVIASGSGDCTAGSGTQTWLIPASADSSTVPVIEPAGWNVLTALAGLSDGSFHGWVVDNGSSIELDDAAFNYQSTLLSGYGTDDKVSLLANHGLTVFLDVLHTASATATDTVYRTTASGSASIGSFSYSTVSVCGTNFLAGGAVIDAGNNLLAFAEPTDSGYSVYRANLASGSATALYTDASGTECGIVNLEEVSANHVIVNEGSPTTGYSRVIGVSESGAADQVPAVLASGDAETYVSSPYIINGHVWIDDYQYPSSGPITYSELVRNGDGSVVATYTGSRRIDDIWGGFHFGDSPQIDRQVVYLYTPNSTTDCNGGTLQEIDPATFVSTEISGVPDDTCGVLAYGWSPTSFGHIRESGGDSILAIDPGAAQLYILSIPQSLGTYTSMSYLPGYPFY